MKKFLIFVLTALVLTSCGSRSAKYDEAELKSALDALLPLSFELNEIYFGEGLPPTDDPDRVAELYGAFAANVKSLKYHPVAEDCGYSSIAEIKSATEAVFTSEYSAYLYELAFEGISSDKMIVEDTKSEPEEETLENGDWEIIESGGEYTASSASTPIMLDVTASYARYLEQNGILTVRLQLAEDAFRLGREYDTGELKIVEEKDNYVVVSMPTSINGEYDRDVKLKLVMTENGWRLDTPTY